MSFEATILDPRKSAFLVFRVKPPQKNVLRILALIQKTKEDKRRTNVLLVRLFENAQKKILVVKNAILAVFGSYVLTVFSAFLKILIKTTFVCLLFLNLKQKKKFF